MGGRGSSSGSARKSSRVIKLTSTPQGVTPKPQQHAFVEEGEFEKFRSMSTDEQADMISKLSKQEVPIFLANNDFQKLTYAIGGNDKPTIVSDSALDKVKGVELFRTVNGTKDIKNGITYDADMIASQIQRGKVTRVSDSGGSYFGRGIYFADNYGDSICYGNGRGNIKSTAVVRAKIDPNAKIISYNQASTGVRVEMQNGSKLGKALKKCDSYSRESIYALSKGYSVITSGSGYYNILSRKALIMSSDVKAGSTKWK